MLPFVRNSLLLILFLAGCSAKTDWDMVSKQDFPAPDGQRIATVFEMCCYCTTGYFPQVSVRRPGEELEKYGNVFQGGPGDRVTVRWLSSTNLIVERGAIENQPTHLSTITNVGGVTVEFWVP